MIKKSHFNSGYTKVVTMTYYFLVKYCISFSYELVENSNKWVSSSVKIKYEY